MSWCPFATKMELQPESDSQPAIIPDQFIFHSIAAPWTPVRIFQYWRDSTNLESHFGLGYDGALGQFLGTQTRADANYNANRRANGHGAISLESASNLDHTDPWTDAQLDALVHVGIWAHQEHGIPLRKCRSWDDPGYGYHRMFPEWSTGGTACPGDARVQQFHDVVFPRIAAGDVPTPPPQESDVTITSKNTANALDVPLALSPDADNNEVWTGLAFGGTTPAVLLDGGTAGKNVLTQSVHLSFEEDDNIAVTGAFYLTDPDGISNLSGYQEIGPRRGGGGHQFVHEVNVPAGRHLRFRVKVERTDGTTTPVMLLHRTEASRTWSV